LVALAQAREVDVVHQLLVVDDDAGRGVHGHNACSGLALLPASGEARAIGVAVDGAAHSLRLDDAVEGTLAVTGAARLAVLPLTAMLGQVREAAWSHAVARTAGGLRHHLAS